MSEITEAVIVKTGNHETGSCEPPILGLHGNYFILRWPDHEIHIKRETMEYLMNHYIGMLDDVSPAEPYEDGQE